MNRKMSSEELIKKYSSSPPPALREYLLMYTDPFFEAFRELAAEYLDGHDAFMYQRYTNIINEAFEEDKRKKKTRIADLLLKGHRAQSEKLSKAILYTVFLYPMEIIRLRRFAGVGLSKKQGLNEDFMFIDHDDHCDLPFN